MLPNTPAQTPSFLPPAAILSLLVRLGMIGFALFCFSPLAQAQHSITLAWNSSPDPTVRNYVVHYGTASQDYTMQTSVGTNTSFFIENLTPGTTYYFSVTAVNAQKSQSAPSGEVSYLVPGILRINAPTNSPGAFKTLSFPVVPGHWYEVQASTNLQTWGTLWQTGVATSNTWVQFNDKASIKLGRRFYRLVSH